MPANITTTTDIMPPAIRNTRAAAATVPTANRRYQLGDLSRVTNSEAVQVMVSWSSSLGSGPVSGSEAGGSSGGAGGVGAGAADVAGATGAAGNGVGGTAAACMGWAEADALGATTVPAWGTVPGGFLVSAISVIVTQC